MVNKRLSSGPCQVGEILQRWYIKIKWSPVLAHLALCLHCCSLLYVITLDISKDANSGGNFLYLL